MDCLNLYNTDFNAKTYAMAQQTNALLGIDLCHGHAVQISTSFAYLIVDGNQVGYLLFFAIKIVIMISFNSFILHYLSGHLLNGALDRCEGERSIYRAGTSWEANI